MIYKCSIKNIEKAKEIETNEKNLDFFIGEIEFLASGNIDDRLYISEEILKEYAHTVLGKFITYKYSYVENDVLSHEVDLQIGGYIPPNAKINFTRDKDDRLVASTECVLSKIYCLELYDLFKDRLLVNSYHHQAIKALGAELKIAAISEDNLIEAVFSDKHKFLLGVQWHPEFLYDVDENSKRIVKAFVQSCKS